jgi:SAM-dependent methyltransferase
MNFDRLAPHYGWMEALTAGGRLQSARTVWLAELAGRRRILSAGEGHGRFAAACAARHPAAELTCVEASPRMLARAQARLRERAARIKWHCRDVLSWQPAEKHDAIVTCFFLDCFTPAMLAEVVAKLADCATPDAAWIIVDFAVPLRGLPRWRARLTHALMYWFFRRAVSLPAHRLTPPDDLLRGHGFVLAGSREFNWGLVRADLWQRSPKSS